MSNFCNDFVRNGVVYIPEILDPHMILKSVEEMNVNFDFCAREIGCSKSLYLRSVSRWAYPSPISQPFMHIISLLQEKLEEYLHQSLTLKKSNVICKNHYSRSAIPFHQDIAYHKNKKNHYSFSCWLSLSNITLSDGPLVCLPRSHFGDIEPAVDFWAIDFIDQEKRNRDYSKKATAYPANPGDVILFNSRIWHGSFESWTGIDRYALVTRWRTEDDYDQNLYIPKPVSGFFGMWNCHEITCNILHSLLDYFNIKDACDDFETVIDKTILILPRLKWIKDINASKISLQCVKILYMASKMHNAGDSQGVIYKRLWHHLLKPAYDWLNKKGNITDYNVNKSV